MPGTETPIYDTAESQSPVTEEFTELIRYRDLVLQLIARNVKTRYKRSVLGLVWSLLNPLMMMVVLSLVFAQIFRFSTGALRRLCIERTSLLELLCSINELCHERADLQRSLLSRIYVPKTNLCRLRPRHGLDQSAPGHHPAAVHRGGNGRANPSLLALAPRADTVWRNVCVGGGTDSLDPGGVFATSWMCFKSWSPHGCT